jgi:chemotaxis protein CheD
MNVAASTVPMTEMPRPASSRRVVVGIGEYAVSQNPDEVIVTHALGSCIAVCVFDPVAKVAAMLHFLLPEAQINEERARIQPGAFADTGIPMLFQAAYKCGLEKKRAIVKLAGGAELGERGSGTALQIGRRNALAAKNLLWKNGVLVKSQDVGGNTARTVYLSVQDGRMQIVDGRETAKEL